MKKSLKKLFALAICAMLVLGMMTSAFADDIDGDLDTYRISIESNTTNHIYQAYQVFSGDFTGEDETNGPISDIQWGTGVDGVAILAALNGDAATPTYSSAEDVAAALADGTLNPESFAEIVAAHLTEECVNSIKVEGGYRMAGLAPGYYLVKDKDGSLNNTNEAYTRYILRVASNVTVAPKTDTPTLVKKVQDTKDSTSDFAWYDSADHDIGDSVPFELIATLPDNVTAYDSYKVVFHDTLSKGLTFDEDSVVVKINGTVNNKWIVSGGNTLSSEDYKVSAVAGDDGTTAFTVTIDDVIALNAVNEGKIIVSYTATLNSDAIIGAQGNPNTAYLEFSNNPNGEGTGKTPVDKVIVFTYKLDVNKVDESGDPLQGAEFTLYKWYNSATPDDSGDKWVEVHAYKDVEQSTFTFTGLDDGRYKLEETASPEHYNTLSEPIYFTISATHSDSASEPILLTLTVKQNNAGGDEYQGNQKAEFDVEITEGTTTPNGYISTTIENKKGLTLPSTGGIGTTLFYVVGGLMMAGAAVLLITKKRMNGCEG